VERPIVSAPEHEPVAIELLEPRTLLIEWADGHESLYPHRLLRERCECAACVDEWTRRPILDRAKLPAELRIVAWEHTGRYGLNLRFSDGHATGIYSFRALRGGCPCLACDAERAGQREGIA
jgi:DUF971 family protein